MAAAEDIWMGISKTEGRKPPEKVEMFILSQDAITGKVMVTSSGGRSEGGNEGGRFLRPHRKDEVRRKVAADGRLKEGSRNPITSTRWRPQAVLPFQPQ